MPAPIPPMLGGVGNSANQANPLAASTNGYNAALGSLNKSLKSLQGSDSSQMMQAQLGLQQNQGKVQQGLINSGLGNTTVAQTLQQAPLQTYNQQIAGIQNNLAKNQAGVFDSGAQLQAQGGNQMAQLLLAQQQLGLQQQEMDARKPKAGYSTGAGGMTSTYLGHA